MDYFRTLVDYTFLKGLEVAKSPEGLPPKGFLVYRGRGVVAAIAYVRF